MEKKPSVMGDITHSSELNFPESTPEAIRQAIKVAASSQFCRFHTDLIWVRNEFSIEASIGPEQAPLENSTPSWYRVRLLIPKEFPYKAVHAIPLDPLLKWNPHQFGDWPIDIEYHANVMCPPSLSEIYFDELLQPYIRYAYHWITDALNGKLIKAEQRYEFPHLVHLCKKPVKIYAEGGYSIFPWVSNAKYGKAILIKIKNDRYKDGLYRIAKLSRLGGADEQNNWKSGINRDIFGPEEIDGLAPWVFLGNPVVEPPHRPPITWSDLSNEMQRRILHSIRDCSSYKNLSPFLLLAFSIPETWGGTPKSIIWQAIELQHLRQEDFKTPNGYRPNSNVCTWPKVQRFVAANHQLQWLLCKDVSKETLMSRNPSANENINKLKIALIGIGSVGSIMAKALSKLDATELLLIDKECIEPGNLVRHEAQSTQVEMPKAFSIAQLVKSIHNNNIHPLKYNVVEEWNEVIAKLINCDLIIEATGDLGVHEIVSRDTQLINKAVAWCYIKPGPDYGVLFLRQPKSALTLTGAELRLKEAVDDKIWNQFLGDNNQNNGIVWPEPGCYHPTFEAPYHRVRLMADSFLTAILSWMKAEFRPSIITLFRQTEREGYFGIENLIEKQIKL